MLPNCVTHYRGCSAPFRRDSCYPDNIYIYISPPSPSYCSCLYSVDVATSGSPTAHISHQQNHINRSVRLFVFEALEPGQAAEFADTVTSEQNGYPRGTSPDEIEKKSLFHDAGLMIRTTTPKTTTPTTSTTKKSAGYLSTVCCGASIFIAMATATMTWF